MSISPEAAMRIISEYYAMQEQLKVMRLLKESIIKDLTNDLPEFSTEADHILVEHDRIAELVAEQILTFSDTTLRPEEHETIGWELLRKIQHQRIDEKHAWHKFIEKWYIQVESN